VQAALVMRFILLASKWYPTEFAYNNREFKIYKSFRTRLGQRLFSRRRRNWTFKASPPTISFSPG
jgi:hypothetical protein